MSDCGVIKKTISVILPVCDEIEYFNESLNSILLQTLRDFELIIIDGSDDRVLVPSILPKDDRIRYLYREKHGIADALNFGLENANGRYIARMDADDISLTNRFERQVSFLEKNEEVDVVGTWFSVIREDGSVVQEMKPETSHNQIVANLLFENPICHPSVMFRRRLIDDGNRYPKATAEDYALWTSVIGKYRFAIIPELLLKWRRSESANTNVLMDKVICSDAESTLSYVCRIFGPDFIKYDKKLELLIKSHFPQKIREIYKENGVEFVVSEYRFLLEMIRTCPMHILPEVTYEVARRWEIFVDLLGCLTPEMERLKSIPWIQNGNEVNEESIRAVIADNENECKRLMSKPLSVVIYGLGAEGKDTIREFHKGVSNEDFPWKLVGLYDRKVRSIKVDETEYKVSEPRKLKGNVPDLVIISSSLYFDEIREDLISMGVDPNVIMGRSILDYAMKD